MRRSALLLLLAACGPKERPVLAVLDVPISDPAVSPQQEAQAFLDAYTAKWLALQYAAQEADWVANTRIVEGDDSAVDAAAAAYEALARHTGAIETIESARRLLEGRDALDDLQVQQLEAILYEAARGPQTIPEVTARLIAAEGKQNQALFGFDFKVDGKSVTTNQIDEVLRSSADLAERQAWWESSKEVGPAIKDGLVELRGLRNETVRALGYDDYYTYQVSDYDLTLAEMDELMVRLNRELRPLYRELHTWVRYELAERYQQPVPEQLPAHWLPNRWAQDWSGLVEVEGIDVTKALEEKGPEWMMKESEAFYMSLGFAPLPASFWEKSSLYPVPADATYKKNNHASAWHLDLDDDVRCLMSVEPNADWFETTNHELGHIYYFRAYSRPEVPLLLRNGANRAFHEAVGSQMGMAAMQLPFLRARGLAPADVEVDQTQLLLKEALNFAVFIPFAAGTMAAFERALYVEELPPEQFNARWWELAGRYQGIAPPTARGEEHADALSKTHISNDAAQYYDYALSYVLLFQLHQHIATEILHQDPRATSYWGSAETGEFLRSILEPGATADWRELLVASTGSELSAKPMVDYFEPLVAWLKKENEGRTYTLPEL